MDSSVAFFLAKLLYYLIIWVVNISMHVDINSSFGDMSFGGLLIVQFFFFDGDPSVFIVLQNVTCNIIIVHLRNHDVFLH